MKIELDFNKLSFDELETIVKAVKKQKEESENIQTLPEKTTHNGKGGMAGRKFKHKTKSHTWRLNELETLLREKKNGNSLKRISKLLDIPEKKIKTMDYLFRVNKLTPLMKIAKNNVSPSFFNINKGGNKDE